MIPNVKNKQEKKNKNKTSLESFVSQGLVQYLAQ